MCVPEGKKVDRITSFFVKNTDATVMSDAYTILCFSVDGPHPRPFSCLRAGEGRTVSGETRAPSSPHQWRGGRGCGPERGIKYDAVPPKNIVSRLMHSMYLYCSLDALFGSKSLFSPTIRIVLNARFTSYCAPKCSRMERARFVTTERRLPMGTVNFSVKRMPLSARSTCTSGSETSHAVKKSAVRLRC